MAAKAMKIPKCSAAEPATPNRAPKAPARSEKNRRHQEQKNVKDDERAAADEAFHFATEHEEHVHLDRKPKKREGRIGRMDEGVSHNLPDARLRQTCALSKMKKFRIPAPPKATRKQVSTMQHDVHGDEQRRDINRMTSHPCHRLVVIGGGDSEHGSIKCARFIPRKHRSLDGPAASRKFAWRSDRSVENDHSPCAIRDDAEA